jgi:hypothetical protein
MANFQRNFVLGRMNKDTDQRLIRNGEYIDAINIRIGSEETNSEIGAVSNVKGNTKLTTLMFDGIELSANARCIGAYEDGEAETIYWFIHDNNFISSNTGKIDMIVSFDTKTSALTYHVVSIDDGGGANTTLNFDEQYLITGVDLVDDLLFFTDNLNPPRKINVTKAYTQPVDVISTDGITAEELLVLKRPPINSPSVQSVETSTQNNFLEERFVSFAYRYRYEDGEYSATSQFSEPSFIPKVFSFTNDAYLNEGMVNSTNACIITYNAGGFLVKSIELLFKDMNTGIIKVIEELDKDELGLVDNIDYTYTFSNSKIFTVLPNSEILRLYDNVPRLAQAQTIMGNRLVYGNYVDGYDLLDLAGNPTKLEYTTELITNEVGLAEVPDSQVSGNYTINGSQTIAASVLEIDLSGIELKANAILSININFKHSTFTGDTPPPVQTTDNTLVTFIYVLQQDFDSVFELATDSDFIDKVGTAANIQTAANGCSGTTFTDLFNCSVLATLDALKKYKSGITAVDEPISIISSASSDVIGFQLPAVRFVDDLTTPTFNVYEYYEIAAASVQYVESGSPKSLHSNRGYEVGIVYMDEYNRSTTALVSATNNIHVPCKNSDLQNKIRVTIPNTQVAPSWASRYKFVIKPDKENYETIYSNLFFDDTNTNSTYFLLEGENTKKVEVGDRLIVKADTNGALNKCAYATVLDKGAESAEFLDPAPVDDDGNTLYVPSGVYMKINANDFEAVYNSFSITDSGLKSDVSGSSSVSPRIELTVNEFDGTTWIDEPIPQGSIITIELEVFRPGKKPCFLGCEEREYTLDQKFTASQEWANLKDFIENDNIIDSVNALGISVVSCGGSDQTNAYSSNMLFESLGETAADVPSSVGTNNWQFLRLVSNQLKLVITGAKTCQNTATDLSTIQGRVIIQRRNELLVFETEPQDALPDLWYESSTSYPITGGFHEGNVQNQSAIQSAIIDTAFFNCFAFGNGVESYKIRDSIVGKPLALGNRTTTTLAQDFKEAHRFADLTYSGVYNDESNVNKLNEFNLGLLNFKPLEDDFGYIMKLDGRQTDILVLQEDKISYVLAGKNLISDSTGGGLISSVPEVLGTQVARSEEYGISFNPESYAKWGYDKFFTDAKRGAVIQLRGSSYGNEQLTVISNLGLRSFFRDKFIEDFSKQKLGGYDPFYNEYVLGVSDINTPTEDICFECTTEKVFTVAAGSPINFCYELGNLVGDVTVTFSVVSGGDVVVDAVYDSTPYTSGAAAQSGSFVVDKDKVDVTTTDITITASADTVVSITVSCPDAAELTVIQVCVTNDVDAGQFIHNEYRWVDGTYISPLHSTQVEFASGTAVPLVSQYDTITGQQGGAFVPTDTATVTIRSNKIPPIDTFDFTLNIDEFRYLRSNTLYSNNPTDIDALLAAATVAAPTVGAAPLFSADFAMPSTGNYLYLIYIYQNPTIVDLCFDRSVAADACCNCVTGENFVARECREDGTVNDEIVPRTIKDVELGDFITLVGYPDCLFQVVANTTLAATDDMDEWLESTNSCYDDCNSYTLTNTDGVAQSLTYVDCDDKLITLELDPLEVLTDVCLKRIITIPASITIAKTSCLCTSNLLAYQCRLDGVVVSEVIPSTVGVDVGSFVTLTGHPADCTFEIVSYSMDAATDTVNTILSITSCNDACNTYQITHTNPFVIIVSYTNCSGDLVNLSIPPRGSAVICAGGLPTALPPNTQIAWQNCGCSA